MTVEQFATRHIGPGPDDERRMLEVVGHGSIDELMDAAIPEVIRWHGTLDLPDPATEAETIAELRALAARNTVAVSMIGLGYHGTHTPAVIRRNVLEDPAWYTAYTPYQPEISQGRLEALLNFQTMVTDLTGLATANASMLDEGTAAAEAMTLARRASKSKSRVYVVDADALPQTIAVIASRAEPLGIEVRVVDVERDEVPAEFFGLHLQYPGASGTVRDHTALVEAAHAAGALVTVAADLLALTLLRAPGRSARTSPPAPPSASAYPWASVGRTPVTWRCARAWSGCCPGAWSGCRATRTATRPTGWRCRPASSTSGGRRRPATSAPRRCCSP